MVLVGYWPLNEENGDTAYDYSRNENHGSVNGEVTQGASGLLGSTSYSFNNTDGRVRHSYTTSPSFTVNIWLLSFQSTWSSSGSGWSDRSSSGFILHPDSGSSTWSGYVLANSFDDYYKIGTHSIQNIQKWNMYTITHDNLSNTSRMFFNGEKVKESSTTTSRVEKTNGATIGHDDMDNYTAGDRPLDGKAQEARFYNRSLTASEIQYLYNVSKQGRFMSRKKSP